MAADRARNVRLALLLALIPAALFVLTVLGYLQ
jgi:hypothetical protein